MATKLPRRSVTLPEDLNERVLQLRKSDKYYKMTASGIIRDLIEIGLRIEEKKMMKK